MNGLAHAKWAGLGRSVIEVIVRLVFLMQQTARLYVQVWKLKCVQPIGIRCALC